MPKTDKPIKKGRIRLVPALPWHGGDTLDRRWTEASGMEKLDGILSLDDPRAYVQALRPDELLFLVRDIGVSDCLQLLSMATTEQWQGFVDIDCWKGDTFEPEELEEWLAVAHAAGLETESRLIHSVDTELLVLYLTKHATIHEKDLDVDFVPDTSSLLTTPDGEFYIEMPFEHPAIAIIDRLMRVLYARDLEHARMIVRAVRWEVASHTEEDCLRWREGRLEELGFPTPQDALALHALVPTGKVKRDILASLDDAARANTVSPEIPLTAGLVLPEMAATALLADALARIEDPALLDDIAQSLTFLANALMVAERTPFGDPEAKADAARRALAAVNMGLDFLADGDPGLAARIIERVWLRDVFQVTGSLLEELRRRATRVWALSTTPSGAVLLDPPLDEVIDALRGRPPRMAHGVDKEGHPVRRPLRTMEELHLMNRLVARAEAVAAFLERATGFSASRFDATDLPGVSEDERAFVRYSTLLLTAVANRVVGSGLSIEPLSEAAVSLFISRAMTGTGPERRLDEALKAQLMAAVEPPAEATEEEREQATHVQEWLAQTLETLEETLAPLAPGEEADRRYLGTLLLLR